jgi:hypothetical protein
MTPDEAKLLATEVAQQVAEQVGQAISQAISKMLQTQAQTTGASTVSGRIENADIGGAERLEKDQMFESGLTNANSKRTYDEYQHESLESIKRNRSYVDKILSDASGYDNHGRNIANQALQNAVETANLVSKQAVRHGDVAIDGQWNPIQQGAADTMTVKAVQLDDASVKAVAAAVAMAFADTLKATSATKA